MKKSRFMDSQIMDALKRVEAGLSAVGICRELVISMATLYKWRAKYGGMDTSMMTRMKELEVENTRLRKMYAEERPWPLNGYFHAPLKRGGLPYLRLHRDVLQTSQAVWQRQRSVSGNV